MSTEKAVKNILNLIQAVVMMFVTVLINHIVVAHWGWAEYGKFSFWLSIGIGIFIIFVYLLCAVIELI
jgi:hypothetical protein